ncbi:uncharacterized protein LOC107398026 [Tribolium castaneum]|uniref:Uncharacterized protein n=1 Tax=Tribolium castaneum TaxID=7070 RepID=A0A139WHJ7_TRICA|nr:hypothetical protein TcasGA2_TC034709 [Tribolium castaneum]
MSSQVRGRGNLPVARTLATTVSVSQSAIVLRRFPILGNVVSVVVWQLQDGFDDDSNLFASVGRCGILVPGRLTGLPGLATTYNWTVCDLFPIGSDN